MSDAPIKWSEDEGCPEQIRSLLSKASATPPLPAEIRASSAAKVAQLGPAKAATSIALKLWLGLAVLGSVVGVAVFLWPSAPTVASEPSVTDSHPPNPTPSVVSPSAISESERDELPGTEDVLAGAPLPEGREEHPLEPPERTLVDAPSRVSTEDLETRPVPSRPSDGTNEPTDEQNDARNDEADDERIVPPSVDVAPPGEGAGATQESALDESSPADPVGPAPSVEPSSNALAEEVALIERGRRALRSSPAEALAHANDHRRRFVRGQLAAAAELLAIDALQRLGRREEAVRRARRMAQEWPSTIYRQRLITLVGEEALR